MTNIEKISKALDAEIAKKKSEDPYRTTKLIAANNAFNNGLDIVMDGGSLIAGAVLGQHAMNKIPSNFKNDLKAASGLNKGKVLASRLAKMPGGAIAGMKKLSPSNVAEYVKSPEGKNVMGHFVRQQAILVPAAVGMTALYTAKAYHDDKRIHEAQMGKSAGIGIGTDVHRFGKDKKNSVSVGTLDGVSVNRHVGKGKVRLKFGIGLAGPKIGLSFGHPDERPKKAKDAKMDKKAEFHEECEAQHAWLRRQRKKKKEYATEPGTPEWIKANLKKKVGE